MMFEQKAQEEGSPRQNSEARSAKPYKVIRENRATRN